MSDLDRLDSFSRIFFIATKKELEHHCKSSVITKTDFAEFILMCDSGDLPWRHFIHVSERNPSHLMIDKKDLDSLHDAEKNDETKSKIGTKIKQLFKERRYLVGHLFIDHKTGDWHFFYFDQRDLEENENHWKLGSHVHMVNKFWTHLRPNDLWERFVRDAETAKGALHLRFDHER